MLFISNVTEIEMSPISKVESAIGTRFYCDITIRNADGKRTEIAISMEEAAGAAAYQQQGDQLEKTI